MLLRSLFHKRVDRILLSLGIATLLLSIYGIFFDGSLFGLLKSEQHNSKKPLVGEVEVATNDIRHKYSDDLSWNQAAVKQKIFGGDSLFSGKASSSRVMLKSGQILELGENTLIVFSDQSGKDLPGFDLGNFRVKVSGTVRIGNREVRGTNAELEVFMGSRQPPQVRLLRGVAKLRAEPSSPPVEMQSEEPAPLQVRQATPEPEARILPSQLMTEIVTHNDHLYDLYESRDQRLVKRATFARMVYAPRELTWDTQGNVQKTFVQYSNSADFSNGGTYALFGEANRARVEHLFLGDNFWHVSLDQRQWSTTRKFSVVRRTLANDAPTLRLQKRVTLTASDDRVPILVQSEMAHTVLEISISPIFPAELTRVIWTNQKRVDLPVVETGELYLRAVGVNDQLELTSPSRTYKVSVIHPRPKVATPSLALAASENREAPPPAQSVPLKKKAPPRKPAATDASTTVTANHEVAEKPTGLARSWFEIEGALFTMYSREVLETNGRTSAGAEGAIRLLHWLNGGSNGLEGEVQSRVAGSPDIADAEVRYLRRWFLPWNIFSANNQSQMSLIVGNELYHNSDKTNFSPGYDLFKLGLGLELPVLSRWQTGGEVLYGVGVDQSREYELSGHLSYSLKRDWSLGAGYRVHLFEAGSPSSAPIGFGIPYREGYGEGYTVLRWHY